MKHLILGTAGHVDHGKTALVRALSGIECDTHKEEKKRGITINLGFAHLEMDDALDFGIVDVPGHRDFIHTMVAGASGIDLAMLVVAADSGVMPQTREHLEIMDVLGIKTGLVALTKTDLVDEDIAELAAEEISELLEGTFLEGCPIVPVSSVTGDGIDALKQTITTVSQQLEERSTGDVFRLFPDRIFTVSGFGTVVTGSVLGGSIRSGDTVFLLPVGKKLRIRRMERHGNEVEEVVAGDRASVNLVGLDREDFARGMVISDRPLKSTEMVDVNLRLFKDAKDMGLWTQVVFHLGTYEQQARVHLITAEHLPGGERAIAQVHLESPCIVQVNDRFVIRSTSSDVTLGGGEIVDPAPLHHRRRTDKLKRALERVTEGKLSELVSVELKKQRSALSVAEIAGVFNVSATDVEAIIDDGLPDYLVTYTSGNTRYLAVTEDRDDLISRVLNLLEKHHKDNPLSQNGRTTEEMMGTLGVARGSSAEVVFRIMLGDLESEGNLKQHSHTWLLESHTVTLSDKQKAHVDFVETFMKTSKSGVPSLTLLGEEAAAKGIKDPEVKQALRYLVEGGRAFAVDGDYLPLKTVNKGRRAVVDFLTRTPEGISLGQLRDLTDGTRRSAMLLFQIFETEGIVKRVGDLRVLSKKGKALAEQ